MSLADYQKQIDDSVQQYATPYWQPLSQLARISEEVGEIARILNAQFGDKPLKPTDKPQDLSEEIADAIYSLLCLANSQSIAMDEPLQRAIAKLDLRDKQRFAKK